VVEQHDQARTRAHEIGAKQPAIRILHASPLLHGRSSNAPLAESADCG
jgi:hypothetical protein